MKFAIQTLVFYGLDTLKPMIQNTGAFVDKIYLSHSAIPWNAYNSAARDQYRSEISGTFIDSLPFREKIVWLEGEWSSEEQQRNHSLDRARADGMDYLIIQDSDEFYLPEDFQLNLKGIIENPHHPVYRCPWTVFWKDLKHVIEVRTAKGTNTVTTCPNFAVNVKFPGISFKNRRLVNKMEQAFELQGLCLHLAWVLSDEEVLQKIKTWGHSHQFDHIKWYRHKWLAWKPSTRYIGHITRAAYLRAVPFTVKLPVELQGFYPRKQAYISLGFLERISCFVLDFSSLIKVYASRFKMYLTHVK